MCFPGTSLDNKRCLPETNLNTKRCLPGINLYTKSCLPRTTEILSGRHVLVLKFVQGRQLFGSDYYQSYWEKLSFESETNSFHLKSAIFFLCSSNMLTSRVFPFTMNMCLHNFNFAAWFNFDATWMEIQIFMSNKLQG